MDTGSPCCGPVRFELSIQSLERAALDLLHRVSADLRSSCLVLLLIVVPVISGCARVSPAAVEGESKAAYPNHFAEVATEYEATTRPLIAQFCLDCHSTESKEGELDLEQFATFADARSGASVWQHVIEMLDNGEMPPKDATPQPSAEQRKQLRDWAKRYIDAESLANAGDPGPVVLRRLSNAEYTYTVQDLTGVDLDPAREFPIDGAAGEGFTNAGSGLVMSPALLTKYLDAGKEIAAHAVLLPDGFRFSPSKTRSDWTNETLARIRGFYNEFAGSGGGTAVNLQGVQFNTNAGGLLQVERYLAATLAEREALHAGSKSVDDVAREVGLNAKYLALLWNTLNSESRSLLLDSIRTRWATAQAGDAPELAKEIAAWQEALFRFSSVGHIGKVGGPKAWQEPVTPVASQQEIRLKLSPAPQQKEIVLYLVAGDAGDGPEQDIAIWQRPRLFAPGRPDLLLRDVQEVVRNLTARRERLFATTARALQAAEEARLSTEVISVAELAKRHDVEPQSLAAWFELLGIGSSPEIKLNYLTEKSTRSGDYDFIQGWGLPEMPSLVANSSDQHVRIPGNMKPRGLCVHPSPTLHAGVGWKSTISGTLHIEGQVTHAHPECGNGVTWSLQLRRGKTRQQLASGVAQGGAPAKVGPIESLSIQPGDLVSLLIGARDNNHSCDLTDLELVLEDTANEARRWSLTEDVTENVLAGNPHADRLGNDGIWHFYAEAMSVEDVPIAPAGSLLARWQASPTSDERNSLALAIQELLVDGPPGDVDEQHPDAVLYRQLASLSGPLLSAHWTPSSDGVGSDSRESKGSLGDARDAESPNRSAGLDPKLFGKHPEGLPVDAESLCVQAPSVLEVRLPAELVSGAEFVVTGSLHPEAGGEGSVQLQVTDQQPELLAGLKHSTATKIDAATSWTSAELRTSHSVPVLVNDDSTARKRFEQSFSDFRDLFPIALCYTEIVPVDEVVTLTLYYREDEPLKRLMLTDEQSKQIDQLWAELHFISRDALTLVDAFEQLLEYASQDGDPRVFEPLRKPINDRAAAFQQTLLDAEHRHVESIVDFAARAYRRPLAEREAAGLRTLYEQLRDQDLSHDEAFRFTLARIFVAPAFLYRVENAPEGAGSEPVTNWELASRLSYFLWSSHPDDELRAAIDKLDQPDVLKQQVQRMMQAPQIRRLATEFATQWLHVYQFDSLDEKSSEHFPEFAELRSDMYEETILFFTDLFQRDSSVLSILDADHTFLSERLAQFYGIPLDTSAQHANSLVLAAASDSEGNAEKWYRVSDVKHYRRGGVLGLATTLAKHSGASRSSPILRGAWVSEVLLGEKLPNPPPGVPPFPEEGNIEGLTVRQITELHTKDARCASCHDRIDHFGFALENYDAIGRYREQERAGLPIDSVAMMPSGGQLVGMSGIRDYLLTTRRTAVIHQFCRKLLGYALGRGVMLSDEPLLAEMQQRLAANDYRFSAAVEAIVESRQFREIRGRDHHLITSN